MNSPFRYAGGKFYARKYIVELLPKHTSYIEPMAGGASLFFAKTKVQKNWLNDIDSELINCLEIIKDSPEELINCLAGENATKDRHNYYKNIFNPSSNLEKAMRWYYLNRTSYSGIMNMPNCFWGYGEKYSMTPDNWPNSIRRTSEKLQKVKLSVLDFEDVIEAAEDGSFLFIDPPYYNADQEKFYTHSFTEIDHIRLSALLRKHSNRFKFLLTYDDSQEIRSYYDWVQEISEQEWNYTINRTDDQKNGSDQKGTRYKGKELFIRNYINENP